jgi:hypothetical protein
MGEKGNTLASESLPPRPGASRVGGAPDHPRTQERPGTGAKDPKRLDPQQPREPASGQITDEQGNYGPTQYSDPDTPRDRNRI